MYVGLVSILTNIKCKQIISKCKGIASNAIGTSKVESGAFRLNFTLKKMTDLYIDLEWFFNQELFLVGYAYSITNHGQLYDESLNIDNIIRMLQPVDGYIYFYGPDIGMLEKSTGLDIRNNFKCVNLLKVFRDIMPGMDSYKLAYFEEMFEIKRSQRQYKSNIFKLSEDWNNPYKKQHVLKYNMEDVINLVRLKREIFGLYGIGEVYLEGVRW